MPAGWVIRSIGEAEPLYWSNDWGWGCDRNEATVFQEDELDSNELPVGGRWQKLNDSDLAERLKRR